MKKLLVINPNASESMTRSIAQTVAAHQSAGFAAEVIRNPKAPEVLESFADYTQAGHEVLALLNQLPLTGYHGIVLACFGDPCLEALKEKAPVPVVGIAEASMALALLLGYKFSILAAVDKAATMMEQLVLKNGLKSRLASVESLNLSIEAMLAAPELLKEKVLERGAHAINQGCEVLIYGCAGMTMLSTAELSQHLGIPVLDPVVCGLTAIEGIVGHGLGVSRQGLYR